VTSRSISLPDTDDYRLNNVRLHRSHLSRTDGLAFDVEGFAPASLDIAGGTIREIRPADAGPEPRQQSTAVAASRSRPSSIATPISTRAISGPANPIRTAAFPGPQRRRRGPCRPLVCRRRRAAHGVLARLRLCPWHQGAAYASDSVSPQEDISWPVFETVRDRWKDRIELQAACLFGIDEAQDENWFNRLAGTVARHKGILGAVTYMVPDIDALLDRMFGKAIDLGLDLDFHADETDDVNAVSLRPHRRCRVAPWFRRQDPGRPLLFAGPTAGRRRQDHARQGCPRGPFGGFAADVQHVSSGPSGRCHHTALAGRHPAA
jgi:cytosine deaminase